MTEVGHTNTQTYEPWAGGAVMRLLNGPLGRPGVLATLIFLAYWGLPLLLCATGSSSGLCLRTSGEGSMSWASPAGRSPTAHLGYLDDRTHLIFAAVLALLGGVGAHLLRSFGAMMARLSAESSVDGQTPERAGLYATSRAEANHWAPMVGALALGVFAAVECLRFWSADEFASWWGHTSKGAAGIAFSVLIGVCIAGAAEAGFLLMMAARHIVQFLRRPTRYRLFHPDRCCGFSPLGRFILWEWVACLAIAGALYVVLQMGYLGIEQRLVTWVLAVVATLCAPIIAIVPIVASMQALQRFRTEALCALEPIVSTAYDELSRSSSDVEPSEVAERAVVVDAVLRTYGGIRELNVWPFNPRALTVVVVVYGIQLLLTLKKVLAAAG